MAQISGTILIRRRADRDEVDAGVGNRFRERGGEAQPAFAAIAGDESVKPRLMDGQTAALQVPHLGSIVINTNDGVAHFRKARAGDEADVAGSDNADVHLTPILTFPHQGGRDICFGFPR